MLEQQRIEYLQAMGIQLWMPRHALDNAAESSWLAGSEANNASLEVSGSTPVKAGHAADLLAEMGLVDAVTVATHPQAAESTSAQGLVSTPIRHQTFNAEIAEPSHVAEVGDASVDDIPVDLTVPKFELHFALWPCGLLWVGGQTFEQRDHSFQTAVSYSLLGNTAPQASYSQFKWPYIEGSNEDQSMAVALRALTAQWDFMSSQGARGWVAMDSSSLKWLEKVSSKALFSVNKRSELYSMAGKKQLWLALQTLSPTSVS
ncbi:MAG: hypothetical protein KBT75_10675 [Oleispira antarctica]|nr:hypothetical protein [Oleispira antarctica]MBQ0793263.1 hypothetical protein [Oleispira antarctica]